VADEFARGFKAWCENTSTGLRKALALEAWDPLPASILAEHLGVTVWESSELPGVPADALALLHGAEKACWSAFTVETGERTATILNSSHSEGRKSSSLMHELSHVVLGHAAGRVDISPDGTLLLQSFDRKQEAEADWLAGCLLLPRDALLRIRRDGLSDAAARHAYRVSQQMLEMRFRRTAVDVQLQRAGRRSARRS